MSDILITSHKRECEVKILGNIKKGLERVGLIVEKQAKINVNKTTGHPQVQKGGLISSITHEVEGYSVMIGSPISNPPYPTHLELGTSKHPPYPWLFPAVEEKKKEISEALKD